MNCYKFFKKISVDISFHTVPGQNCKPIKMRAKGKWREICCVGGSAYNDVSTFLYLPLKVILAGLFQWVLLIGFFLSSLYKNTYHISLKLKASEHLLWTWPSTMNLTIHWPSFLRNRLVSEKFEIEKIIAKSLKT